MYEFTHKVKFLILILLMWCQMTLAKMVVCVQCFQVGSWQNQT